MSILQFEIIIRQLLGLNYDYTILTSLSINPFFPFAGFVTYVALADEQCGALW